MDGVSLQTAVDAVAAAARTTARYMPEPFSRGVDFAQSLARAGLGVSGLGENPQAIIDKQIELQQEMLQISLVSNVEKTRHEIKMAPTRNIRVG